MIKFDLFPGDFRGARSPAAEVAAMAAKEATHLCSHLERMLKLASKMSRNPDPDIRKAGEKLRAKVREQLDLVLAKREGAL